MSDCSGAHDCPAAVHIEGCYATDPSYRCSHDSATGVDQAPFGPDKVWRCDVCGWLYRSVPIDQAGIEVRSVAAAGGGVD